MHPGATIARAAAREAAWLVTSAATGRERRHLHSMSHAGTVQRLLDARFPGVQVASVRSGDATRGTTDRDRLHLEYTATGRGATPPDTVFVKRSPARFATRVFVNLMQLATTEARWYRELASSTPVDHPDCYGVVLAGRAQRCALVLEDLDARGARFTDASRELTADEVGSVLDLLATLHAATAAVPAWLPTPADAPSRAVEQAFTELMWERGLRRFPDLVTPALRASGPAILAARDEMAARWSEGPLVVVHGDCHAGNLFFTDTGPGLLDWQCVQRNQGARDVAYFLANSVPTDLRRTHERAWLDRYRDRLVAAGAPDVATRGALFEQYRSHLLHAWIAIVVTAALSDLQAEHVVRAAFARTAAAVEDLDALARPR